MKIEEAKSKIQAALDAKTSLLVAEIRRLIVDRPFVLSPGATKSSINGIHFEYDWSSFHTVACPLNTSTGYCGSGEPLTNVYREDEYLIPAEIEEAVLQATPDSDQEAIQDSLDSLATEAFRRWFAAGWKIARDADSSVRGFLSVHDTIWRTDLDTGEEFREDAGLVKFF